MGNVLEHSAGMRRVVGGDQSELERFLSDRIPAPSTWSSAIARPTCLSGRTGADFLARTREQAPSSARRTDRVPVLLPIITKAKFQDIAYSGRSRHGSTNCAAIAGNHRPLFEYIERRLATRGRHDQTVPGDLETRGKEALGIRVTRLVRQVNEEGTTRPHSLDNGDGLRKAQVRRVATRS